MNMIQSLREVGRKRAAFHRTVSEIEAMPLSTAQDLGIFREDARKIARKAVYGV